MEKFPIFPEKVTSAECSNSCNSVFFEVENFPLSKSLYYDDILRKNVVCCEVSGFSVDGRPTMVVVEVIGGGSSI